MNVNGKDYAPQTYLEVKNLRSGYKTVIEMKDIKFDQGLLESEFTETVLAQSRW